MAGEWLMCTRPGSVGRMTEAVRSLDGDAVPLGIGDGVRLREFLRASPGRYRVAVGFVPGPVSDVNLAAAIAHDGTASQVVLVREEASGSLKSRACQAGIDVVVEGGEDGLLPVPLGGGRSGTDGASTRPAATGQGEQATRAPEAPARPPAVSAGAAPVLTFCSGRGGVGKTTIAAASALVAASWGMRVVGLDLDLALGNLAAVVGQGDAPRIGVEDGALAPDAATLLAPSRASGRSAGIVVVGPCARPELAEAAMPHVGELLAAAHAAGDLVLVDTSSTVTDGVAQAMQACDRLVLVSDDQPGGLASVASVGGLAVRLGIARTRVVRLENCGEEGDGDAEGQVPAGLEVARVLRVAEGGPDVADLAAAGRLADVAEACPEFWDSVASCLAQLLSELGRLPDSPEAHEALEGRPARRRWHFGFSGRRAS